MEPFLSEIFLFAFNFAPHGFSLCSGQLMAINQNAALFSLLGTTYGGNGTSTFMLPDTRGRTLIGYGSGSGLATINLGQVGGEESITLNASQIPAHTHTLYAQNVAANTQDPNGQYLAIQQHDAYQSNAGGTQAAATAANLSPASVSQVGGSQPHENRAPFLALNYCIALSGVFPSRS